MVGIATATTDAILIVPTAIYLTRTHSCRPYSSACLDDRGKCCL